MEDEIQLKDIIAVLNQYKWLIILATLLATLVAATISFLQPKVYEAKAQMLVTVAPGARKTLEDKYYGTLIAEKLANTFSQIAQQENLLNKAAKKVKAAPKKATVKVYAQTGTQLFTLTVQYPNKAGAFKLARSLSEELAKSALRLNQTAASGIKAKLLLAEPASWPKKPVKPNLKLNLLVGFLAGLLGSLSLAFIFNALREEKLTTNIELAFDSQESKTTVSKV